MFSANELLTALKTRAHDLGVDLKEDGPDTVRGEKQSILVKWFLGQRKVTYRMALRLAEAEHVANFREAVNESSWGILPPTFSVEKSTVSGWERSGTRADTSPAGGGKLDYGELREALKQTITDAGWQFHLEGGRAP